jgi:purine-nucleoside phosphorylase
MQPSSVIPARTTGGIHPALALGDVVAASATHTDSAITAHRLPGVHYSHAPPFALLRAAADDADGAGRPEVITLAPRIMSYA